MAEELLDFLNEIQKLAIKIKIQEVINSLVKDERVNKIINADMVIKYYEKMHEHFDKDPQDFLFPNREWVNEALERLGIDLSNVFDENENPDHIKREEIIVLFLTLWVNMKLQDRDNTSSIIKEPYNLFNLWRHDKVLVIRPTTEFYLQDGDNKVMNLSYKKYGWFTDIYTFIIDEKGIIEYRYTDLYGITNTNNMYKRKREISKVYYNYYDIETITGSISELSDEILKEKERLKIIRPRNTKFIVRKMTGMSNKEYKALLNKYNKQEEQPDYNYEKWYRNIIKLSGLDLNNDFIIYVLYKYFWLTSKHLIEALLKLKDKENE